MHIRSDSTLTDIRGGRQNLLMALEDIPTIFSHMDLISLAQCVIQSHIGVKFFSVPASIVSNQPTNSH